MEGKRGLVREHTLPLGPQPDDHEILVLTGREGASRTNRNTLGAQISVVTAGSRNSGSRHGDQPERVERVVDASHALDALPRG